MDPLGFFNGHATVAVVEVQDGEVLVAPSLSRLHRLITAHDLPSVNPNASQSMLDRLVGPRR